MRKIWILALSALAVMASCTREEAFNLNETPDDAVLVKEKVTFTASLPAQTKTALGVKDGDTWPNYWSTGDIISVNGVSSEALDGSFNGKTSATFTVDGVAAPYNAGYPVSAFGSYSAGSATVTVPAAQTYVAGSYDPAAYVMLASTSGTTLSFKPQMAIFKLTPTGSHQIVSVSINALGSVKLAGEFSTDFSGLTPEAGAVPAVTVTAAAPVEAGIPWFIVIPAVDLSSDGFQIVIHDKDGGTMTRQTKPSKAWAAGKMYAANIPYTPDALSISAEGITSSTAVICITGTPADEYTVNVYSDSGCSSLVDTYTIPAGDACWGGESPRFCVSGLDAGTTYYVKVSDVTSGKESSALPVTTEAFDIVSVTSTPAAVGDVILAEDFGELRWDCDMIGNGAGFFATSQDDFANNEVLSYQAAATSSEKALSSQGTALAASRLEHWAQGANANLYIHPGYIKLVGSSKVTHVVTPALDNIPEGRVATLEVEVTASRYYSASSDSYATANAIVAVQAPGSYNELVDETKTNTLDLSTNIQAITLPAEVAWNKFKVTLTGVAHGSRIAFGADSEVTGNNARMNLSDIKVKIVDLKEVNPLQASFCTASSSTLSFTWTYGGEVSADIAKPWTITLYKDEACTQEEVSFDIPADNSCWNNKQPKFVFSGLKAGTDYWFKAKDTTVGAELESDAIKATTEPFTIVYPEDVATAAAGDVILAEDFGELLWCGDLPDAAAGYDVDNNTSVLSSRIPSGTFQKGSNSPGIERVLGSQTNPENLNFRIAKWAQGRNNLYIHPGYFKFSTNSTNNAHIITPALTSIPEGYYATVEVTVTAAGWGANYKMIGAVQHSNLAGIEDIPATNNTILEYGNVETITLNGGSQNWSTQTLTLEGVVKGDRIAIGSTEEVSKGEGRIMLSDVVVSVKELIEIPTAAAQISDYATLKSFVENASGIGSVQVIDNVTLTSEQAAEIAALLPVDFAGDFIGGSNTITGLTKPLFDTFSGEAQFITLNSALEIDDLAQAGIFACNLGSGASLRNVKTQGSISHSSASALGEAIMLGGLAGKATGATLTSCMNEATVTNASSSDATISVGGLVGVSEGTTYVTCYNEGAVENSGNGTDATAPAVRIAGLIASADGANTISGDADNYNYNNGTVYEHSASTRAAVAGVCAWANDASTSMNYAQNLSGGGITVADGEYTHVYIGGVLGFTSANTEFSYTKNAGDITIANITITSAAYIGGVNGGTTSTAAQTITGCENTGAINCPNTEGNDMKSTSGASKVTYIGGISSGGGNGAATGGKTFTNCINRGDINVYNQCWTRLGGVLGYANKNPEGCENHGKIVYQRKSGGYNSSNGAVGGVVGYINIATVSNLTNTGGVQSTGSSPNCYTGGIVGQEGGNMNTMENCNIGKFGINIVGAGSGSFGNTGAGLFVASNSTKAWTFTGCKVITGTKCQGLTVTSENMAEAVVGRKHATSITDIPTLVDSF